MDQQLRAGLCGCVCLFAVDAALQFSETGFLCVSLAVLELTVYTRLVLNSASASKCWDKRRVPQAVLNQRTRVPSPASMI